MLACRTDSSLYTDESWITEAEPGDMRSGFEQWEPRYFPGVLPSSSSLTKIRRVKKLLDLVEVCTKRKLFDRPPLLSWAHPSSRILLLGDACHPVLVSHLS